MKGGNTVEAPKNKTSLGIDENSEALLSYVLGWVTRIVFLALERENKFVRFHAAQSLAVFLPLFVAMIIIGMIPFIGWFLSILIHPDTSSLALPDV